MARRTTQTLSMSADKRANRSWSVLTAEAIPCVTLSKQGYESFLGNPADHGSGPSKMT